MRNGHCKIGLTGGLALLASLAFAGTASATTTTITPACGAELTASPGDTLKLGGNVGPCPAASGTNGALTIKASGTFDASTKTSTYVTVDLNGHTVRGCDDKDPQGPCNEPSVNVNDPSLVAPFVTGEGPGIVVDGQNDVKITDSAAGGTVRDFDTGIVIRGGSRNVIEKLDILSNVGSAASNSDYGEGIGIYTSATDGSTNNTVRENNVDGNGPFAGVALYNFDDTTGANASSACATKDNVIGGPGSNRNTVNDNYVTPNGTTYQDDGIRVEPKVCNTVVENNEVTGSSLDGIAVFADATGTKVQSNTVRGNGSQPLPTQRKGDGIVVFQRAHGCTVSGNTVGGTNEGDTVPGGKPPPSTVQGNAGNGIRVDAHSCSVNGNTATGNAFNERVNGRPVSDPRGDAAKATNTESQYAYYDLKDGQVDKRCGASSTTPTGGARNYWGNSVLNMYGSRNRVPGEEIPVLVPPAPGPVPPAYCIE